MITVDFVIRAVIDAQLSHHSEYDMQFTPISSLATAFVFVLALLVLPSLDQQSNGVDSDQANPTSEHHAVSSSEVTALQAYAMLNAKPDILFIDVRDPVEIARVGHPEQVDAIVPIMVQSEQIASGVAAHNMVKNASFVKEMHALLSYQKLSADHEIVLFGGPGPRVFEAAAELEAAGFSNLRFIVEDAPASFTRGAGAVESWKSSGLPWTKDPVLWGSEWRVVLASPVLQSGEASQIYIAKVAADR